MKNFVAVFCLSLIMVSNGWSLETVTFLSNPGPYSPFQIKRAKAKNIKLEPKEKIELTGYLGKPTQKIPAPAVILLHSGFGLQNFHKDWAERLAKWGYVSLLIYSYAAKDAKVPSSINLSGDIVSNAYGAYEYLEKQPYVDPDRIGFMGWSSGGKTVFSLIGAEPPPGRKIRKAIKAAATIYPVCNPNGGLFTAPILILLGDNDSGLQKGHCRRFKQAALKQNQKQVVELKVYSGATHFFDNPQYPVKAEKGDGQKRSAYYYDPKAHQDSLIQIREFFKKFL